MKKIKLLTPILSLTALAGTMMPLAGCSQNKTTDETIPEDAFKIVDVTLKGFKPDFDYKNYSKLIIPSNVKVIDEDAFNGLFTSDTKVNTVVINSNVETIRKGAFANNNNITVYDFSDFDVDSIHKLTIESGAFDLLANGIYSYFKMNDNWTEVQKQALKLKLIEGGVPSYCFVKQTTGNVAISSQSPQEQIANGGTAQNVFDIKGYYSQSLKYEAALTVIEASEGVDLEHYVQAETSQDNKKVYVDAKMVAKDGHIFTNDDFVTYKVTLICYTGSEETNDYKAQWCETLETFKLTYHQILLNITANQPTKWKYQLGDTFNPDGLTVNATFSNKTETVKWDGSSVYTNLDNYVFTKEDVINGVSGTAFYKYEDTIKEAPFNIEMQNSLAGLKITKLPVRTWYEVAGETLFDPTDLTLEVSYISPTSGESTKTVYYDDSNIAYTCDTLDLTKTFTKTNVGTHTIKVTYNCPETQMSMTTTFELTVADSPAYFNGLKWDAIVDACNEFEKSATPTTQNAKDLINALGVSIPGSETITDPKALLEKYIVGLKGTITINGLQHQIRCIGAMHDTISGTTTKAALTFELADLLSDTNGDYMLCQWSQDYITDYLNSTLRACLTGKGTGTTEWYHISDFEAWIWEPLSETRSALEILEQYSPAMFKGMKKVDKEVWTRSSTDTKASKTKYSDELFVLSPKELGVEDTWVPETTGTEYCYWSNHKTNADRIRDNITKTNPFEEGGFYYWTLTTHDFDTYKRDTIYDITPSGAASVGYNCLGINGISFAYCI